MPSAPLKALATLGSFGSSVPSWNASGFLRNDTCLRPDAVSPASYKPGVRLARGSFASDPVIPAGSGGAACGANGSCCAAGAGVGLGDCVCARPTADSHKQEIMKATKDREMVFGV